jgi:hypothetical protein
LVKLRGPLALPEIVRIFTQVLDDLELAHSQAMIHRDITSARIVREGNAYKLTDYGVSRIGTVRYMSPERCQGKPVDARSDTYSLGVALYEAATGRLPFDGALNHQIIDAQMHTPPPSPHTVKPDIAPELEHIILRALSKTPAGRFQNAAEFRQALKHLKTHENLDAELPPPVPQEEPAQNTQAVDAAVHRRRSRAALFIPAAGAVLVLVAFMAFKSGILSPGPRVPKLIGMSRSDAEAALRGQGFSALVEEVDDSVAAGVVAAQSPAPGSRLRRSGEVRVSVGSGRAAVPAVAGSTEAEASVRLTRAGLTTGKVDSQYSDSYPVGVVTSSTPAPGTRVALGTSVNIVVASGRATCPQCGARREAGARFCIKCGYKY